MKKPKLLSRDDFKFYNKFLNLRYVCGDFDIRNKRKYTKLCSKHYRNTTNKRAQIKKSVKEDYNMSMGSDFMVPDATNENSIILFYDYYKAV